MSGFNLPPGCRVSDIPGNRPEDLAREAQAETVDEVLKPLRDLAVCLKGYSDVEEKVNEQICTLLDKAHGEGYQQACNDAKETEAEGADVLITFRCNVQMRSDGTVAIARHLAMTEWMKRNDFKVQTLKLTIEE